ncbi:MAG: hypothetical protein ACI9M6_000525, partial [Hydrogenophaga sp.]
RTVKVCSGPYRFNGRPQRRAVGSVFLLPKRTARSRTSGENFGELFVAPSSQKWERPQNPGQFNGDVGGIIAG